LHDSAPHSAGRRVLDHILEDAAVALIPHTLTSFILKQFEWENIEGPPNYKGESKIEALFGASFWDKIRGKTVLDFGCGNGEEALEIARHGAARVIGLDSWEERVIAARARQAAAGLRNCTFVARCDAQADVILSVDAFEHYDRPDEILREMARLLKPGGKVMVSFGPPWLHPRGAHFPLFPWAHLLMTEKALMVWRAKFKLDGATKFGEVQGGLNQMTISKFERLAQDSPLQIESLEAVPIRAARMLHCKLTREFLTSVVRCTLIHRDCSRGSLI
jgi:SAM-dependent methyltransferase